MELTTSRVLVFGAGISGIGAARLLLGIPAKEVILYDGNEKLNAKELEEKVVVAPTNDNDASKSIVDVENAGADCGGRLQIILGELPGEVLARIDLAVLSPGVPTDLPLVNAMRERGVRIWGEVELAWECGKGDVLAVTGTNGKTTTTSLLGEIMRDYAVWLRTTGNCHGETGEACSAGKESCADEDTLPDERVCVVGNIGNPYTDAAAKLTEDSIVVAEISSFQLETIEGFAPRVSAILNITPDHLNRHHTMEEYIRVKELITENQGSDDTCVLNYEDPILRELGKTLKTKVIYFSSLHKLKEGMYLDQEAPPRFASAADCIGHAENAAHLADAGENICYSDGTTEMVICSTKELNILGRHNHENVMAAAAMAHAYGVPFEVIRKTVCSFQAVEHRIEYVTEKHGVVYYNDSKGTNPDAAIKGIQAMDRPTLLIGGGYDKNSSYEEWIQAFNGKVKYLVLIGQTREKIAEAAKNCGFSDCVLKDSLEDAVAFCAEHAKSGDAVLLSPACASWGMFPNYEVRGRRFKELVNQLD
ncbi:MAG: UDP-N-acetylmuramoyl-L-alanine--D-glutamate ligase [Clostridiales bacterium]|nr:UDP-N-acetylmuramoyl-L-alanine--D-glutamate ligase [Clostridiales bacterium]